MRNQYLNKQYKMFKAHYPNESEYLQAISEVLKSLDEIIDEHPEFEAYNIVERILEPERVISFKVTWLDDDNNVRVNRGYRVQHSALIGPYKGGLRFHPSVTQSILKFLAFEQTLKNSLTNLPMGGGKGGSDFDPKGKSDCEIMTFCQAFMRELFHHLGENIDVPAGDIGVGQREIGYLYGYYKKITNQVTSSMTGKNTLIGGSLVRREATGFGLAYFVDAVLNKIKNTSLEGKKVTISGSGNVAIYAAEKVKALGGIIIAMSDSNGYVYDENGLDIDRIKYIKEDQRGRIKAYVDDDNDAIYIDDPKKIWEKKTDIALPCATQNELDESAVKQLIDNEVLMVGEGANMPTTDKGKALLQKHNILFAPSKAANAGGVLVSGFEIAQSTQFDNWTFDKINDKLKTMMEHIFDDIYETAKKYNKANDLQFGVNVYSFQKLAKAMIEQGIV
ncbi:MAG: NADP-specific glutamate dehydrogenase [Bacillota bacterium]